MADSERAPKISVLFVLDTSDGWLGMEHGSSSESSNMNQDLPSIHKLEFLFLFTDNFRPLGFQYLSKIR